MPASRTPTVCRGASSVALLCLLASLPLFSAARGQGVTDRSLLHADAADRPAGARAARMAAARIAGPVPGSGRAGAVTAVRARSARSSSVVDVLLDPAPGGGSAAGEHHDLPDFLPWALRRDLHDLRRRVQRARTVLFGRAGIVDMGRVGGSDLGRLRLNLQYDPHPGVRFVLVLR